MKGTKLMTNMKKIEKAFTLIELLIVVAIIAILAAIAVPNFLEAQMRAKVSRVKADLRTISIAMESYTVDNNAPPLLNGLVDPTGKTILLPDTNATAHQVDRGGICLLTGMTTPIAYMSTVGIPDPFVTTQQHNAFGCVPDISTQGAEKTNYYTPSYINITARIKGWGAQIASNGEGQQTTCFGHWARYLLLSVGPDHIKGPDARPGVNPLAWQFGSYSTTSIGLQYDHFKPWEYDPTNGTSSGGDILRWSN